MTLPYQRRDEINDRYSKSIILYGGTPVYCQGPMNDDFGRNLLISYMTLGAKAGDIRLAPATDPAFSDGPFKLGYVNDVQKPDGVSLAGVYTTSYCERIPVRRWKQGLTAENLKFSNRHLSYNIACKMDSFIQMIQGKYPSVDEAIEKLRSGRYEMVAYARRWALCHNKSDKTLDLYYRGARVGSSLKGLDNIILLDKYQYLREAYEQGVENAKTVA